MILMKNTLAKFFAHSGLKYFVLSLVLFSSAVYFFSDKKVPTKQAEIKHQLFIQSGSPKILLRHPANLADTQNAEHLHQSHSDLDLDPKSSSLINSNLNTNKTSEKKLPSVKNLSQKESTNSASHDLSGETLNTLAEAEEAELLHERNKTSSSATSVAVGAGAANQKTNVNADKNSPTDSSAPAKSKGQENPNSPNSLPPKIFGNVDPLVGVISYQQFETLNPIRSVYSANNCINPRVQLFDLVTKTILSDNPIEENVLDESTSFEFDPVKNGVDLKTPTRYLLKTSGCEKNYERIITSFYQKQDLTAGTTLISKTINASVTLALDEIPAEALDQLIAKLNSNSLFETDLSIPYNQLETVPEIKNAFAVAFGGAEPVVLKNAAPEINNYQIPTTIDEKIASNFSISLSHWNNDYVAAYEWYIDNQLVSNASAFTYTAMANSNANIALKLIVGKKNAGDNLVDKSHPFHQINSTVAVRDTHPVLSPEISLLSPSITNQTDVDLELITGIFNGETYQACETFDRYAIVESPAELDATDFTRSCTGLGTELINYALINTAEGMHSIYIYAIDKRGLISSPRILSLVRDTTAPLLEFTNLASVYKANRNHTILVRVNDANSSHTEHLVLQLYNGSVWVNIDSLVSPDGSLVNYIYSSLSALPDNNIPNARFRAILNDAAGNSSTITSDPFIIQRPNLVLSQHPIVLSDTLAQSIGSEQSFTITNSSLVEADACNSFALSGINSTEFSISVDNCSGQTLAAGGQCQFKLTPTPSTKGNKTANLDLNCGSQVISTNLSFVATNNIPVKPLDQFINVDEDVLASFTVSGGSDIDLDSLIYVVETPPAHGVLSNCLANDGDLSCQYLSDSNYNGSDYFSYTIFDGTNFSTSSASVFITVLPTNDAPTMIGNQTIATNEESPVNFTLLGATDIDLPSQTLSYQLQTAPTNGVLSGCDLSSYTTNRNCTYTPNANFNGSDTFTYLAYDGVTQSLSTATVTINVSAVNDAPTLSPTQTIAATEDTVLNFNLGLGSDIDADTLTYIIVSTPAQGSLSCTGGTSRACTYTPDLNDNGSVTFTYKVNDGNADSNISTVTINISAVNDAPVLGATQAVSTTEDTLVNFNLNSGSDVDGDALTYEVLSSPASGTLNCTQGSSRACSYTPANNFNGSTTFTYRVSDGNLSSITSTVTITVTAVNDAPTLASTQAVSTNEDTLLNFNLAAGSDVEGSTLSYQIVSTPDHGVLTCTGGSSQACSFTPDLNYYGTTTFTYKTNDGALDSNIATVTITINPINDAPTVPSTQSVATNEDTAVSFELNTGSDIEGSTLTYTKLTDPASGTLVCTGGTSQNCTYTPVLDFIGSVSFTYRVSDGALNSNTATVTITVTNTNDSPVIGTDQTFATNEDTLVNFTLNNATDIDVPAQTLQYIVISAPTNGTLSNCITTGSYSTDLTCTYTPNANFFGTDSFTYKTYDGVSQSNNVATVTINVAAINDAPVVAANQNLATSEDTLLNFNISPATDVDIPAQTLSYKVITAPTNGTLTNCISTGSFSTDLSCTYTPNSNYNGSDSFTVQAYDSVTTSITNQTINITVNAINDAPTLASTQSVSTNEDTVLNFNLNAGSDVEGSTLSYIKLTDPSAGTLSCAGGTSRACTYTPATNFNGDVSFTYKVNDGSLDSNTSTVTITVAPVNDAPTVASTQTVTTNEDTAITFDLNAGSDIEGSSLTYVKLTNPASGTLTCTGGTSRSCTYTPAANVNGSVSFTYNVSDGALSSNTATVTINITAVNDAPTVASTQTVTTNEDTALTFDLNAGSDTEGATLTYLKLTNPASGTLTCTGGTSRSCTYTPAANINGSVTFTYNVSDGSLSSNTATVTINITPVNDAPTLAATQSVSTNEDTVLNFNLTAGADVDGDTLTYTTLTSPASGTLSCSGGTSRACTYTPALNFNGTTTFTYRVSDGALTSGTNTVTITVVAVNDAPTVASTQTVNTNEDTAITFDLNAGTDTEGSTLTYVKLTNPASGTLTCTGGTSRSCTYTPSANYNGAVSFTYNVSDGALSSNTATVTINIAAVNDAPTLASTQSVSTNEDTALTFDLALGTDIEGSTLTYTKLTNPATGTLTCTGGTSRSCTYTPASNINGSVSFTYKVNDGSLDSNTATVTITINPINDRPVVGANQAFAVDDNTAFNFTLNSGTDIDVPAQTLQYKVITAPANGVLTNCITTAAYSTDLTCTYTANTNYNGTDSFTYLVNDTVQDSVSVATVTFTVSDKTRPSAPSITIASNLYTNSLNSSFTATSCSDKPFIFINEGTEPLPGAAGWISCSTTAGALTYTMSAGAGTKAVKLWAKDANGNVSSTSANFSIVYETTLPTIAITAPTYVKGSATYTVNWTATETNVTTAQNFTVEYYNGSTWSTLGTVASTNGPLSATAFSYNWSVPAVNITTARLRISLTDRAGNTGTSSTGNFTIDSIVPTIAITTPAENTYYPTTNATITGTCEGTLPITFAGALQSSFNVNCNSGSFTQNVNFSNGDGVKLITLTITDLAGNTTTLNRTLHQDTTAPYLTRSTGANPQYTKNNTVTWGGTCEGNLTINFTGSSAGSFNCVAGAWSWTVPSKTVDGNYSYSLQQVDSAGNTSTSLSLAWTRDNVAPALTVAQGTSGTNNLSQMTFSGNCEGVLPIVVSGTESDTFSCNNGTWSYTTNTYSTDAARAFTFTQTDTATNSTARTYTWTRNTLGPALYLTSASVVKSNVDTVTYSGTCANGLTINITGSATTTTTCNSGSWTWTSATFTTDATRTFNFSQTNAVPNTTTVTGTWYRKTTAPTVSAFSTTAPNPSRNATIPTNITAASGNANVFISEVCAVSDVATKPDANHICWEAVNGPVIAKSPAASMSITNYPHLLGWEVKAYVVYVWVKDEAGNISNLTASGAGTLATDKFNSFYDPGITPVVADVWAANVDTAANPPTISQATVPAGSTVYIHWKATDNTALPAGSISLFYTSDEINFLPIAGANALNNQNYSCPAIVLGANEGCFKWTNGSPLSTAYKIQVVVNDQTDLSAKLISNPLNTGQIKILAGNTESGLGGSAQSALFFTRRSGDEPDPGSIVMTTNGRIYFADYKRGIITVDPSDGNQKVFIPMTGTSTGDGGPAVDATLRYPSKIALDYQNRLLIMDVNRIRRVDLNLATPTIETIIGGGADTADTVTNPLNLQIYSHSTNSWATRGMVFFATPNGDIYFHSDYTIKDYNVPTYRLRIYKAATGQVLSKYFGLTSGDWFAPTNPLSNCRVINPGLRFDPSNSTLTGATVMTYHHSTFTNCDDGAGSGDGRYSRAYFDPSTFAMTTNFDDSFRFYRYFHITGMDGNTYILVSRAYVNRVNFDGTYTRVLGSGTPGVCADGTAANSCNVDVQDYFVTSQGKVYFIDGGLIRTIDEEGKVVTLFGQRSSYGNNVNALNARFDNIYSFWQRDNGNIIVGDNSAYYIKEFSIEGNINIIAGNGNYASTLNTAVSPTAQGLYSAAWFAIDPATGDLFLRNHYYRISKHNRESDTYENIIGCGTVDYWDLDGQAGINRKCNGSQSYLLPLGYGNNKLLLSNMKYNTTGLYYEDFMWKAYDKTTSFTQSHVAGTNDPLETYNGGYTGMCASGTSAAICKMPYYSYTNHITWDGTGNRWITIRYADSSSVSSRELWSIVPGGNATKIAQIPRTVSNYIFIRDGGNQHLVYCSGGRLYRHNVATDTDIGALTWSMTNMICKGASLQWNSTRRSVIFAFEQNGLDGIAEYYLP